MEFTRECPECKKELTYTQKDNLQTANTKKLLCRRCTAKNRIRKSKYKYSTEFKCITCTKDLTFKCPHKIDTVHECRSCAQIGDRNGFYGKKHTEEAKEKFSNTSFKKGNQTGNLIPIYDIWVKKYGLEEADRRKRNWKKKISLSTRGEKNPMYGKPPSQGSGNGWSGWYKDWFFRSLRELSYMIKVLEKEGLKWEMVENKNSAIPYINYDGVKRNYFADFLVENTRLIEVKPKRLHSSVSVLLKKNAAEKYCEEKGWTYELLEPEMLTEEELLILYKTGALKFLERYEEKFKEKYIEKFTHN